MEHRDKLIARARQAARTLVETGDLLEADLVGCSCWGKPGASPCMACKSLMKADKDIDRAICRLVGNAGRMEIENIIAAEIEAIIQAENSRPQADAPSVIVRDYGGS